MVFARAAHRPKKNARPPPLLLLVLVLLLRPAATLSFQFHRGERTRLRKRVPFPIDFDAEAEETLHLRARGSSGEIAFLEEAPTPRAPSPRSFFMTRSLARASLLRLSARGARGVRAIAFRDGSISEIGGA